MISLLKKLNRPEQRKSKDFLLLTGSKILILVVILTIFIAPISTGLKLNKVGAVPPDATGTCLIKYTGVGEVSVTKTYEAKSTEAECRAYKPAGTVTEARWTSDAGEVVVIQEKVPDPASGNTPTDYSLGCSLWPSSPNLPACIAGIFYTFWSVSASVAELGGHFLDFFVYYSTNSDSYKNPFVEKGWGAVRDVANVFFIIVLLFVAIKMVLSLDDHGNKKLIGAVIVVALVINFSLFATKVVIDSSNILAKVFYNNITVENKTGGATSGSIGEKSISIGLIKKFNPQVIVQEGDYDAKGKQAGKVGPGQFIFITLMLLIITIYTAYVFFSVALLFVARVVSLWLSMIFSPFAFLSFAVPFDMSGLGHKKWLDKLLKNAFLAPLFIFFLYIIVMFTDFLPSVAQQSANVTGDWMQKLMTVVIPFAILMMLLHRAKSLAEEYSGEMGNAVMSAGKLLGGLAVGGGALGLAAAGRGTVGAFMKGASTGDTAAARLAAERDSGVRDVNLTRFQRIKGTLATNLGIEYLQQRVGGRLSTDQHNVEHAAHARHDLDTAANTITHGKKKKWDELNGEERYEARRQMARDRVVRENSGAGTPGGLIPGGLGTRKWDALSPEEQAIIDRSAGVGNDPDTNHAIAGGALARNQTWADLHTIRDARRKQGIISNVVQSSVTGTFDARNLADVMMKEQSTSFAKITQGLTGAIAMSMRGGFKSLGVNYGQGQGAFIKDLGHTITEALKNIKVHVDVSHVGEEKKEGDHGGGGHH